MHAWDVAAVYELLGFALNQNLAGVCLSAEERAASLIDEKLKDFHAGPSCLVRAKFQMDTDPSISKVDTTWIFHWELSDWLAKQSDPKATYYQLLDELRVRVSKACEHLEGPLREVVLEGAISPTTASSAAAAPSAAAASRASPVAPSPRATRATSSSAASPTATAAPVAPPLASQARRSPRPADPEAAEPPPRSNAARKRAKTS